jgi:hypothetical protein
MNQSERDIRVFSGMPSRLATLQDLPVLLHRPGELLSQESNSPTARRASLANRKPAPRNPANRTPLEIVEKVLHLRRTYHLSPLRIVWYLAHYHDIKISDAGVYRILRCHGLNRLPRGTRVRKIHTPAP